MPDQIDDQGFETALGLQIIELMPDLRRFARKLTRTADQADDLVQDTVERALMRETLYQQGTNLRAWLFTMMRNISITQARKATLRRTYATELMSLERPTVMPSQIDTVLLKSSLAYLAALTPGEREAVALLGIQDMSYEEAAAVTGLPVGTMKSRLSRGRSRLRELADLSGAGAAARSAAATSEASAE